MAPPAVLRAARGDRAKAVITSALFVLAVAQLLGSAFVSGRVLTRKQGTRAAAPLYERQPSPTAVGPRQPLAFPTTSSAAQSVVLLALGTAAACLASRRSKRSPLTVGRRTQCLLSAPQTRLPLGSFPAAARVSKNLECSPVPELSVTSGALQADLASVFAGATAPSCWMARPSLEAAADTQDATRRRRRFTDDSRRHCRGRRAARRAASSRHSAGGDRRARRNTGARLLEQSVAHEPNSVLSAFDPTRLRSQVQQGIRSQSSSRNAGKSHEAKSKSEMAAPTGFSDCHTSVRVDCCLRARRKSPSKTFDL